MQHDRRNCLKCFLNNDDEKPSKTKAKINKKENPIKQKQ